MTKKLPATSINKPLPTRSTLTVHPPYNFVIIPQSTIPIAEPASVEKEAKDDLHKEDHDDNMCMCI